MASNYRYLYGERESPAPPLTDSIFELDESDVWNNLTSSPDFPKPISPTRISKPASVKKTMVTETASSLPVNVPDWSKILKEDFRQNRRRESDFDEFDYDESRGGSWIPPHEFLAKQLARTRIASFSVHEGIGRTLKGRDLSRVRNAIWEKIGFED